MNFDESILNFNEKAVFALRTLYSRHGYRPFKMSKFEEYDLYSKNKDFLVLFALEILKKQYFSVFTAVFTSQY